MACFTNVKSVAELKETKDIQTTKNTLKNYLENTIAKTNSTTLQKDT